MSDIKLHHYRQTKAYSIRENAWKGLFESGARDISVAQIGWERRGNHEYSYRKERTIARALGTIRSSRSFAAHHNRNAAVTDLCREAVKNAGVVFVGRSDRKATPPCATANDLKPGENEKLAIAQERLLNSVLTAR